jgi:SanA protein
MSRRTILNALKIFILSVAFGVVLIIGVILEVQLTQAGHIFEQKDAPSADAAIVLGASINRDGTPSDALRDRIMTAVDLYHAGKVKTLFMTGDDGDFHADEIDSMVKTAQQAGVPENAIEFDGQGYRTYESCKRASQLFHIKSALIITQRFHLGRALYLCRSFGMEANGVIADRQPYIRIVWFWLRDLLSSAKAFWDVRVWPPKSPVESKN